MSNLIRKIRPSRHWLMLIPLILSGWWFAFLEMKIKHPEYLLYIHFDDHIPFAPLFVLPYVLWYFYVAIPAVYLFLKSPGEFTKMALFLAAGMAIACTVYSLFPNGQALRPSLSAHDDPLIQLIRLIYKNDTPTNSAPSIHVIYSVAAHAAIFRHNYLRRRIRWVNRASFVLSVLCILSTVFIKQHSVIDLAMGLLVSGVLYLMIYDPLTPLENRVAPGTEKSPGA